MLARPTLALSSDRPLGATALLAALAWLLLPAPAAGAQVELLRVALAGLAEPAPPQADDELAALVAELASPDAVARELAVAALIERGDEALPMLRRFLEQVVDPAGRLAGRRVFSALTGVAPETAAAVDAHVAELLAAEHPELQDAALWLLEQGDAAVAYVRGDERPRGRRAQLLRRVTTLAAVRDLAEGHNKEDAAATALAELGEDVLDELAEVACCDAVPSAWAAVSAERLVALGGAAATAPALELARRGDAGVRALVVPFLGESAEPDQFETLVRAVAGHLEAEAHLLPHVEALARRAPDAAVREHLGSGFAPLRRLAARLAGERRDDAARDGLKRLLRRDDGGSVEEALLALGRLGDEDDLDAVVRLLDDERTSVRRACVEAVSALGGLAWTATALADPDPSVRVRAARCLAASEDEAAVEPLIAVLADDHAGVLSAATRALERLTSADQATLAAVADADRRRAVRRTWERWWDDREEQRREQADEARADELERARDERERQAAREAREQQARAREEQRAADADSPADGDSSADGDSPADGDPSATEVDDPLPPLEPASDDDAADDEPGEVELARHHATTGGRILQDLKRTLQRQFRPYGELKEQRPTETDQLVAAAVSGMLAVLDREADDDDPELETLDLDAEGQRVLRHLLRHGRFDEPEELGRLVTALPLELSLRDAILLVHEAADSMVRSLGDRFTRLGVLEDADGEVDEDAVPSLFGKSESNGLMLEVGDDGVRVEFVFALGSAHRAGLRLGDKLLSLNGELVSGEEEHVLNRKVNAGPAELLVLRDGWTNPVRFQLEPEAADPELLVTSTLLPGDIGYVRLRDFSATCSQEIEWDLRALEKQGARALVLDLRGNPGGMVYEAVEIVDAFVPAGETITTLWQNSGDEDEDHDEQEMLSSDSDADRSLPLAVLIDGCSASASEMTSGALQDLERAVVVGRTSWGKGIGQNSAGVAGFTRRSVFGESTASLGLSITVLEYFLPSGRSIQGVGVEPDISVVEPSLLGERFELVRRARHSSRVVEYVAELVDAQPGLARELARYDGWDPGAYPGFDELEADLRLHLETDLVRAAVRQALRDELAARGELQLVDVQADEDLRAAVAALAEELELDLAEVPEYEDLAD